MFGNLLLLHVCAGGYRVGTHRNPKISISRERGKQKPSTTNGKIIYIFIYCYRDYIVYRLNILILRFKEERNRENNKRYKYKQIFV